MMTAHIFAGGEIKDLSFISISSGDMVICADSGLKYAEKLGIMPDIVVGDFDSYDGILPENAEIIRSVPEKDDTDTLLALRIAIERGADNVRIYGAFGGRLDHTAANIQTLRFACEHGCTAVLEDADNIAVCQQSGEKEYPKRDGWYFSVFALDSRITVKSMTGVKYPLENYTMTNSFPIGVSNEITADKAVLSIDGSALVIMSRKHT